MKSLWLCALAWWLVLSPSGQWAGYVRVHDPADTRLVEPLRDAGGRQVGEARWRTGGEWELILSDGRRIGTVDRWGRFERSEAPR